MTTTKRTTNRDPSVPRVTNSGVVRAWATALANLTASEALPVDDPAQGVLLARAQVYGLLAVADTWVEVHG